MKPLFILVSIVALLVVGCNTSTTKKHPPNLIADTAAIINVHAIIKNDMDNVLQTPFAIKKTQLENKKVITDTFVSNAAFASEANAFLQLPIQPIHINNLYTETVFKDASTNSVTINYTSNNPATSIKNIDVLLTENGQTTKRIFIKQVAIVNDTLTTVTYGWKLNKSFQINRSKSFKNNILYTQQLTINWNDN